MITLPNVTLISYDNTDEPERTMDVLQQSASLVGFAAIALVCRTVPKNMGNEDIHLVTERGYPAAMAWEVGGVSKYVDTDFALCIHYDANIQNEDGWKDEFLDYDFIGAPWPKYLCNDLPEFRVGNTGFCLKSKRFMQYCAGMSGKFNPETPGDVYTCRTIRPQLEALGIRFAPLEVAASFAYELNIEEWPFGCPDAFGFHSPS